MMAMSLKRDIERTSLPSSETVTNTLEEESPSSSDESKMPLCSGLSALIQAATVQLGQADDATTTPSQPRSKSDNDTTTTNGTPKTPRYTPHGFHITPPTTKTTLSFQDGCPPSSQRFPSSTTSIHSSSKNTSSLNNTPTLGPEPSDIRKQTFPEVLMTVLEDKANANVITFLPDGKYFAVRRKEFSETTMMNYFSVATFEEFLTKIHSWGFSRIERGVTPSNSSSTAENCNSRGIEIFRHPLFVKGDWERCSRICFGESPTEVRLSALPDRARIEYTLNDESTLTASKRRLSPSHVQKDCDNVSKQRLVSGSDENLLLQFSRGERSSEVPTISKSESGETTTSSTDASTGPLAQADAAIRMEDDVRSLALAITTEKLNLKTDGENDEAQSLTPLVERAVENATHTIVTDAIETLLRDEGHTRETYLKHERELSRSSLPGVVPISKQLFSPLDAPAGAGGNHAGKGQQQLLSGQAVDASLLLAGIRMRSAARMNTEPSSTTVLTSNNSNNNMGVAISASSNT